MARAKLTKEQWEEIAREAISVRDGIDRLSRLMQQRYIKTDKASAALGKLRWAQSNFRCHAEDQMFLDLQDDGYTGMFYPGPSVND